MRVLYLNAMSLFTYDPTDKNRTLAAHAMARAQRVSWAVRKYCSLAERGNTPVRAVDRSSSHSNRTDFCRLRKSASIKPTRLDPKQTLKTPPHRKRLRKPSHEGYKVSTPVSGSRIARRGGVVRVAAWGGRMDKECLQCRDPSHREAHAGQETEAEVRRT